MDYKIEIANLIKNQIEDLSKEEIIDLIEIPPEEGMGDFAFPCFKLAKIFRKSPNIIAEELASKIEKKDFLEKIENKGSYINFFIDSFVIISQVKEKVMTEKENYCKKGENHKNIVVEYSSPNIAKPFHIGHIRTTVIGHFLDNLFRYQGYNVTSVNHLGDYGTQFGKLIVAYKKWGNKEDLKKDPIRYLLKLYVKFHEVAEDNPSLEDDARLYFKKLEQGDEEAKKLWLFFREESLKEFDKVYDLLNIKFDSLNGESYYQDKMPRVLKELNDKNLIKESEGAMIVDLEKYDMPPALVQKSDGSTLYLTRDLAAAIYRKETYDFYKNVYVVGAQQELYFKQWKKVLELLGYDWANDCVHVKFGTVSLEGGMTLSTRKGNVVFLEDVFKNVIEKSKQVIEEKNPNLENIEELSKEIGVGAVVFQELSTSRTKDYSFSMDRTLSFEGETGPYVQYTHARACSVIRKANGFDYSGADMKTLKDNQDAIKVIKIINTYNDVLERCEKKCESHHVARYLLDLSSAFNKFYHDNPILVDDENEKKDRLTLTMMTIYAIRSVLNLMSIASPTEM